MTTLKGFQKKYLRGLAHSLKPVVIIGQHGVTPSVLASVEENIEAHELIKVKFNDFKEKDAKEELTAEIVKAVGAECAGMIGHTAILFRPKKRTEKRVIKVPKTQKA